MLLRYYLMLNIFSNHTTSILMLVLHLVVSILGSILFAKAFKDSKDNIIRSNFIFIF